ncbi:MAG: pitrilysin family protein, partial [Thermodesulfobacteriota bacterium]
MRLYRKLAVLAILSLSIVLGRDALAERAILKTKLDNGLTVILEEDHSAPVAAFQMWVRVGSADEKEKEAGIAHVFEHMLFKGTEKRGVGEIAKEVEGAGGYVNAYTSYDNTVYHLAVASRFFSAGLDIMSDAIRNSTFDPVELKKELQVVLEEIRMGEDNPGRKLYKTILETAYTTHPYKRHVIGSRETVEALTRDYILEFFGKWYVPNNMTLVVVGDFDGEEALAEIKESFKGFNKGSDPHTPRPVEPPQTETRAVVSVESIAQTHMGMAFHIPELR